MTTALHIRDLGHRAYRPVHDLQKQLVAERQAGDCPDTLVLVEHDPVYTLGRSADEANVLISTDELDKRGIEVVRIERGGDVTFHGPGQLVGYPILDLQALGLGAGDYIGRLEEVLVGLLAGFGIEASGDRTHRGVWVGDEKIAALGVRIARGVSMHGFALNVQTDLAFYEAIVPCGIRDKGVTSMDRVMPDVEMGDVKRKCIEEFVGVFGYDAVERGRAG